MENKKIRKINLKDDSSHIAELLTRYIKKNEPFQFIKNGRIVKHINNPSEEMDEINKILTDN